MAEFIVQRKAIIWEQQLITAESFDEAIEIAEGVSDWREAEDAYLATEDYWVQNVDTEETRIKTEHSDWEDSI
jgi:hypothetical protein